MWVDELQEGVPMRKIALFVGELPGGYQTEVTMGVVEEAAKHNVQCFVYTNTGVYNGNVFFAYGEKNVIHVPYLKDYDGIIIAGDTFGIEDMYEELTELAEKEAVCPVVCLRQKDDRFYNVLVNNYQAMGDMVEHFILHHGFTRICFMTGKLEMYDAQKRLLGYIDTMQKHGIEVTPDMVFEGDYWRNKGAQAVEWFCKDKEKLPQAIVCANDFMAVSICKALHEKGIKVPEEVCVSGYDDTEESKYSIPSITSMHVDGEEMGREAFRIIQNVSQKKEQPKDVYLNVHSCLRGSCGCSDPCDTEAGKVLFAQKENIQRILYHSSAMSVAFENEDNFFGLVMTGNAYIRDYDFDAIYMCFCDEAERQGEDLNIQQKFTEKMHVRAVFERGGNCRVCDEEFLRRDMLPAQYLEDGEPVYVLPFHEKNNCMGYIAYKTHNLEKLKYIFTIWLQGIANTLDRQRMYEASKALTELRRNYNKDALTGIGNRREIDKAFNQCYERMAATGEMFCVVSIDMDGLKIINDKYGHLEGDTALCTLADILAETVEGRGVAARIGGDEYLLCLAMDNEEEVREIVSRIRTKIDVYNLSSHKPWELDASVGYAFCRKDSTLLSAMQQADKNMYQEKRGKKNTRLRK